MKSLVCGASGFIGSHLVKRLESEGHEVECLRIRESIATSRMKSNNYDYIFYLSSYGNMNYHDNDLEIINANILALYYLLHDTKNTFYKSFINFSSSSVMLPYETMYSATKAAGERIVKAFVNKYDKPIINVRPFTVIGKGEQPDHLIPKLINSCIKGDQIPFTGSATHDYIGINDFCEAVVKLLPQCEQLKGQTVDIGTGKKTYNEEVYNIVRRITNKIPNVVRVETMRPYDTDNWVADPTVIKSLGWEPKQSLEDVIKSMVD